MSQQRGVYYGQTLIPSTLFLKIFFSKNKPLAKNRAKPRGYWVDDLPSWEKAG